MIPAAEKASQLSFGDIKEKAEKKIRTAAKAGKDRTVVLGATDHVNSSKAMDDFIAYLEDKGYDARLDSPNLFISW